MYSRMIFMQMMECTSVEVNTDDPEYRTEFGQSCVELSEMSLSSTPIACQTDIVKEKCPISCKAELPPTCFSGMPVPPKPGSAFSKGARCVGHDSLMATM